MSLKYYTIKVIKLSEYYQAIEYKFINLDDFYFNTYYYVMLHRQNTAFKLKVNVLNLQSAVEFVRV